MTFSVCKYTKIVLLLLLFMVISMPNLHPLNFVRFAHRSELNRINFVGLADILVISYHIIS